MKEPTRYQRFVSYLSGKKVQPVLTSRQSENIFYFGHDISDFIKGMASKHEPISKVSSREIEMHHLYHRAMNKPGRKEKKRLMK